MRRTKHTSQHGKRLAHTTDPTEIPPPEGIAGKWKMVPDAAQMEAAVRRSQQEPAICVVCKRRRTFNRSVYAPSDPEVAGMGAPLEEGHVRAMIYAVCDYCIQNVPDYMQVVEFAIKAQGRPTQVVDGRAVLEQERSVMQAEADRAARREKKKNDRGKGK